jgi:hypothetical protein
LPGFNVFNLPKEEWTLANNDAWFKAATGRSDYGNRETASRVVG